MISLPYRYEFEGKKYIIIIIKLKNINILLLLLQHGGIQRELISILLYFTKNI